jgi:putative ABC transport system permease protein
VLNRFLFNLSIAAEAIRHNTLRAGLTSLGIVFGVASVIAMLAVGKGAEQEILEQMKLLGTNNVILKPLPPQTEGKTDDKTKQQKRFSPGLSLLDVQAIAVSLPNVRSVSAEIVVETIMIRAGLKRSGKLVGVDSTYFGVSNFVLAQGNGFGGMQASGGVPVCVIGSGVKAKFFPTEEAIGKYIKCGTIWLKVIGILQERRITEQSIQRLGIRDYNMDVYIPLETMLLRYRNRALITARDIQKSAATFDEEETDKKSEEDESLRLERKNYHQLDRVIIQLNDPQYSPPAADVLARMLQRRHNTVVDVEVTIPELLLQQERRTKTIFNIVLGAIASISLIVGGIGIMNIMLASILERIREIGVRRALGATQQDIILQFLAEAVTISLAGGVVGIVLGVIMSIVIEQLSGVVTIVSFVSALLAFAVSVAVGLLFGFLPARRAAHQDPVECLRYE